MMEEDNLHDRLAELQDEINSKDVFRWVYMNYYDVHNPEPGTPARRRVYAALFGATSVQNLELHDTALTCDIILDARLGHSERITIEYSQIVTIIRESRKEPAERATMEYHNGSKIRVPPLPE